MKGNILDLIITNNPDRVLNVSDGGRLGKSDHCIINLVLVANPKKVTQSRKRQNWSKADTVKLKQCIKEANWQEILERDADVEAKWAEFKRVVDTAMNLHVPKSTCKPPEQPKWITREIIRLLGRKKRAWKVLKLYPTQENLGRYKSLEKEVTVKIRKAKRNQEKKLANPGKNNARTFASYIKSKTKAVIGIGPIRMPDGTLATEDKDMAELLNNFFASVFTVSTGLNLPRLDRETEAELSSVVFTKEQVLRKIRKLKENSAGGPDRMSAKLLKAAESELCGPLQNLFSQSMALGQVPRDWRTAEVVPIYKKGPRGEPGNYQPVSLTSIPGKLMKSLINDELMSHLTENRLIRKSQHGFMPGRS